MGGEIYNLIQVWLSAVICLCYCYGLGKITSKGTIRLLCVMPVVCVFLYLPLKIQSVQLGATTSFFLAWLANFKLLLFAFGKGPLSTDYISLLLFVAVACLPIKIQPNKEKRNPPPRKPYLNGKKKENPSHTTHHINGQSKENQVPYKPRKGQISPINYAIKCLLLATLVQIHDYSEYYLHPKLILCLYCLYVYFFLEIALAIVAAMARALLGLELEPQFDEPYLSTSLQDFWGRRWNLMVTSILRPTVYDPVLNFCARLIGRRWAPLPAVLGTFVVSALMHEIIFYHFGRVRPTWEITFFFLLHGVCLTAEIALKKALVTGSWRLPRPIASILTIGFVMVTAFWLFFPQLIRCRAVERGLEESAALGAFAKNVVRLLTNRSFNASDGS